MSGFFGGGGGSSVDLASPSAIGSTTPNTGAFTTLSANNGTLTSSSPAFTLAQTWNSAGVVFTALRANVTDTASNASSLLMDLQVGGSSRFSITKAGNVEIPQGQYLNAGINSSVRFSTDSWLFARGAGGAERALLNNAGIFTQSGGSFGWSSSASVISTIDLYVYRDAANILAQRNSTNAQTFRLYNTFTDASNYERGFLSWTSNTFRIGTEKLGTGLQRNIEFYTDGTLRMYVTNNAVRMTNNAYLTLGTGGVLPEGGGASDYLLFRNNSGTELGRFQGTGLFSFAGTTSSFPALKRSSAVLQARLADDSGFAQVQGKLTTDTNYTTTAPSATGYLTIYDATGTAYKVLCST